MSTLPHDVSARFQLRDATQALHRQVDQMFARFDLKDREGYKGFLLAHGRVVPRLEQAIGERGGWSGWSPRAEDLFADIVDLGARPPAPTTPIQIPDEATAWGLQYVLEGSRLGGAILAQQVGDGLPRRYLTARQEAGSWRTFQAELEQARAVGGSAWDGHAKIAAQSAFDLFRQAADEEADGLSGR